MTKEVAVGKRVRIRSGYLVNKTGVIESVEEDRQVANVLLDPCEEATTSEEDYDNLDLIN